VHMLKDAPDMLKVLSFAARVVAPATSEQRGTTSQASINDRRVFAPRAAAASALLET
jgi:hypothetical protein